MDAQTVGQRATRGAVAMLLRQGLGSLITIIGGVALARLLPPAAFGLYAITLIVVLALRAFADGGIAAAVVQSRAEPSRHQLGSVFTVQQLIVSFASVMLSFIGPLVARAVDQAALIPLLYAGAASLVFTSLSVVPTLKLERQLRFERLGVIGVAQTLAFYAVACAGAVSGFGVQSFAIGMVVQAATGCGLSYAFCPWRPCIAWDPPYIVRCLRFGLPYQGITLISMIKDAVNPLLAGSLLGAAAVGYIGWANSVAAYAVLALMPLQRLYLPTFARLQHDPRRLSIAVERTLVMTNGIVAPAAVTLLVFITPITSLIYGNKWLPAVSLFVWFWVANLVTASSTPLLGLVNAVGRSDFAFVMAIIWAAATWLLTVPLALVFGITGFAIANALVQLTNIWLFRFAGRLVEVSLIRIMVKPWLVSGVVGTSFWVAHHILGSPRTLNSLIAQASGLLLLIICILLAVMADERRILVRTFNS